MELGVLGQPVFAKAFHWGGQVQRAAGSDMVAGALVLAPRGACCAIGQRGRGFLDDQLAGAEAPELGSRAAVGAFSDAVELGAFRRQDRQRESERLTGVLEPGAALAAAIELD